MCFYRTVEYVLDEEEEKTKFSYVRYVDGGVCVKFGRLFVLHISIAKDVY